MVKFLPSYVGSKRHWVSRLAQFKGMDFVELFAGSAILSANLAKTALLNDRDPVVSTILSRFDELIVPETFTQEDYFEKRSVKNWWQYVYCFQRMSFSGVFRYSKNGYNVPVKKNIKSISVRGEFEEALARYKELKPVVTNKSYLDIPLELMVGKVVVIDPPYEGSQASYNGAFDYAEYWKRVSEITKVAKAVVLFDSVENIERRGIPVLDTRKMRVNGARQGHGEGLAIFQDGAWLEPASEKIAA